MKRFTKAKAATMLGIIFLFLLAPMALRAQISITNQATLTQALQTAGSHTLAANVELNSSVINATATCTITGNGTYKISRAANGTSTGITINTDGITVTFVNVVFDGQKVVQQTASDGTAMLSCSQPNSTLVLNGCTMQNCYNTANGTSKGGAICILSGNCKLANSTIGGANAGNRAAYGAGIYNGGILECSGTDALALIDNMASQDGGGIYNNSTGTILLSGTGTKTFTGNQATGCGGAIYNSRGEGTPMYYTINVTASPAIGGTVSGSGAYEQGASCTVTTTLNSGYSFINWTENGTVVSTDPTYTFTITASRHLVANLKAVPIITARANPTEGGTVSGGGTYNEGQSCTLTATANSGYNFANWTDENGTVVSTNSTYTFTVTESAAYVANFVEAGNFSITATAHPKIGGTVSGDGTYNSGSSCTLVASNKVNHVFENWTENGTVVSTNATYTFAVTGHRNLVANYRRTVTSTEGQIAGKFTINDRGDQVYFSKGNLQYKASTNTWRFAINQYDHVGAYDHLIGTVGNVFENGVQCSNLLNSSTYSGWIDLFGWATSGYNHGGGFYQPWSSSCHEIDNNAFLPYGMGTGENLDDHTGQADWGYNKISNGGNAENTWRTLTKAEWKYIFRHRTGMRYAFAEVNGVDGLILLPDDWNESYYSLNNVNIPDASYGSASITCSDNTITAAQWGTLEQHGAVFLPVAGVRHCAWLYEDYYSQGSGVYHSASWDGYHPCQYVVYFYCSYNGSIEGDINLNVSGSNMLKSHGLSVRLVRDVQ